MCFSETYETAVSRLRNIFVRRGDTLSETVTASTQACLRHTVPNCYHSVALNRTIERLHHVICAHE
jgi:hypothetical protein